MKSAQHLLRLALVAASLSTLTSLTSAQSTSMNFSLDDLWLLPDISNPGDPPMQMTGTFRWTYPVGHFENGSGEFLNLNIPWYGTDVPGLIITIDLPSIEFVKRPPVTTVDVDMMLFFLNNLSPVQAAVIDTASSRFEVQLFGIPHQGHVISGSVIPDLPVSLSIAGSCPSFQFTIENATRLSQVALLRAGGLGAFVIPTGKPCAGTLLSLSGSVALAKMLTTDATGKATLSVNVPPGACGTVFLQALDLSTCRVSAGMVLP